jgi:hypothetical protein
VDQYRAAKWISLNTTDPEFHRLMAAAQRRALRTNRGLGAGAVATCDGMSGSAATSAAPRRE